MDDLFKTFLFPAIAAESDELEPEPTRLVPVLDSRTRKELYDVVSALCDDMTSYDRLLHLSKGLLITGNVIV